MIWFDLLWFDLVLNWSEDGAVALMSEAAANSESQTTLHTLWGEYARSPTDGTDVADVASSLFADADVVVMLGFVVLL